MASNNEQFPIPLVARAMQFDTLDQLAEELTPDEHSARRENERFFGLNDAVFEAELQGEAAVYAVLAEVNTPNMLDVHEIHMETHANDIKSDRFRLLHPLLQDAITMHYRSHEREVAIKAEQAGQMRALQQQAQAQLAGPQQQRQLQPAA